MKTACAWIARLLLAGVFGYAAALKLKDPAAFALDIGHYRLLPYPATLALAVYLPWLELLCAVGVLTRRGETGALTVLLGLCLVFTGALAAAWWRNLDITCGCFGESHPTTVPLAMARVVVLTLVAGGLLMGTRRSHPFTPTEKS